MRGDICIHITDSLYYKQKLTQHCKETKLIKINLKKAHLKLVSVSIKVEKVGLKLNIQKRKIMASGPITSWEIDGETVETVADFIFLGSKITADGDCSHGLKDAYSLEGKL